MKVIEFVLALPKSIYYSLRCFPLKEAIRLPIFISWNTKVHGLRRQAIETKIKPYFRMFEFGIGGSEGVPAHRNSSIIISKGSKLSLSGKVHFGQGSVIRLDDNSVLTFGDNVRGTKNVEIYCSQGIEFDDDVLIGWNVAIRDSDGHKIYDEKGKQFPDKKQVTIGKHVWICTSVNILKGCVIPNGCVIGYGSLVTKAFDQEKCIIAGNPARIVKERIVWEH